MSDLITGTKVPNFNSTITSTSLLICNQYWIGLCNYPTPGNITIYPFDQTIPQQTYQIHKAAIKDGSFFTANTLDCLSIGLDNVIYVYGYNKYVPKKVFAFDYMDYINDSELELRRVRWCKVDRSYILAFSNKHFVPITRTLGSTSPLYYRCCAFDSIEQAEFLPFSSNCTLPLLHSCLYIIRQR